jgi:tellurite resistance protein TerC
MPLAAASVGAWAGLAAVVAVMVVIDLAIFARGERRVSVREAAVWSVIWILAALAFGVLLWFWQGEQDGSEYLAGYLIERSLSIDNLFVFALLFQYFAVPPQIQARVLAWGIGLALVLRLAFILAGAALLETFHVTLYAFGLLLIVTAYRLARHDSTEVNPERNPVLQFVRRRIPMTGDYVHQKVVVREGGRRIATPLLAVFVAVATTDIVFAIDSIPAIFAITFDPYIVFAANAFAMCGLRALYFLLVGMLDRFVYLTQGLSIVLGFVGLKMLLTDIWKIPIWLSMTVIVVTLLATVLISLRYPPPQEVKDQA